MLASWYRCDDSQALASVRIRSGKRGGKPRARAK